jgi:hypothetical protein
MKSGAGSRRCVPADEVAMGPQIVKPGTPAQGPEVRSLEKRFAPRGAALPGL